jgi:hypothetical protein
MQEEKVVIFKREEVMKPGPHECAVLCDEVAYNMPRLQ